MANRELRVQTFDSESDAGVSIDYLSNWADDLGPMNDDSDDENSDLEGSCDDSNASDSDEEDPFQRDLLEAFTSHFSSDHTSSGQAIGSNRHGSNASSNKSEGSTERKKAVQLRKDFLDHCPSEQPDVIYEPLSDTTRPCIRLMTLVPGTGYEPVQCTIQEHPLETAPEFDALSYYWGSPDPPSYISVSGYRLKTTRNLKSALAFLRFSDQPRLMWVDAVCINQGDNTEKGSQVSMMQTIFAQATQTLVWLGESDESEQPGPEDDFQPFLLLEQIVNSGGKIIFRDLYSLCAPCKAPEDRDYRYDPATQRTIYKQALDVVYERPSTDDRRDSGTELIVKDPTMEQEHLDAFIELLARDWFRRIWALQEVAVARKVLIRYGNATIEWHNLAVGAIIARRHAVNSGVLGLCEESGVRTLIEIAGLRGVYQRFLDGASASTSASSFDKDLHILSLAKRYRTWNATDPRDKIYALLGLSSLDMEKKYGFYPDYRRPVEETYRDFAEAILQETGNCDLLSVSRGRTTIASKLAFWIPDWSDTSHKSNVRGDTGSSLFLERIPYTRQNFGATKGGEPASTTLMQPDRLQSNGYIIDQIQELAGEYRYPLVEESQRSESSGLEGDPARSLLLKTEVLQGWEKLARVDDERIPYPTRESNATVYRRVLNLDMVPKDCSTRKSVEAFEEWRRFQKAVFDLFQAAHELGANIRDDGIEGLIDKYGPLVQGLMDKFEETSDGKAFVLLEAVDFPTLFALWSKKESILKLSQSALYVLFQELRFQSLIYNPLAVDLENMHERRLARTKDGLLALVPAETSVGDSLVLLAGEHVPFVLRSTRDDNVWEYVGDSYVHGVMHGERWDASKCSPMELASSA